ncbi:MAG: META domain-containing protein [Alphaproteobacteria bacterium]
MKKTLYIILLSLIFTSCSKQEELSSKTYTLTNPKQNTTITLGFNTKENRFFGKIINNFFGTYNIDGKKITFSPAGTTMMMGPQEAMEAEQDFLKTLPNISSYKIQDKTLTLNTSKGDKLIFTEIQNP